MTFTAQYIVNLVRSSWRSYRSGQNQLIPQGRRAPSILHRIYGFQVSLSIFSSIFSMFPKINVKTTSTNVETIHRITYNSIRNFNFGSIAIQCDVWSPYAREAIVHWRKRSTHLVKRWKLVPRGTMEIPWKANSNLAPPCTPAAIHPRPLEADRVARIRRFAGAADRRHSFTLYLSSFNLRTTIRHLARYSFSQSLA